MTTPSGNDDEQAIRELIGNHFEGMKWTPGTRPDWARFSADFIPDAVLVPAARPAKAKTPEAFIERMNGVAKGNLHTFEEHTLGMQCLVFGNIAVVLAASEMLENGIEVNHDVSGYLLVKSEGRWLIAAHAWDKATEQRPVPEHLRRAGATASGSKAAGQPRLAPDREEGHRSSEGPIAPEAT